MPVIRFQTLVCIYPSNKAIMTLSNLYLAAADKLRHKGLLPDSRPATLTMCASELGRTAPTGERALLEKFLTQVEKRIDKFAQPDYKMPPAMRIAAARAAKEQTVLIGVGGW
jgi:hypothetical protein